MTASAATKGTGPRVLNTPEKVATLLLAMGKPIAGSLLKHFDDSELKRITRAAAELGSVPVQMLDTLVDEFEQQFSIGVDLRGNAGQAEQLLAGALPPEQVADIMSEIRGNSNQSLWERLSSVPEAQFAAYLAKEHPQTAALILSKVSTGCAAKVIGQLPARPRNDLMRRMLGFRQVSEATVRLLEAAVQQDLLVGSADKADAARHARMADIINRMEREHMEEALRSLSEADPRAAEALKGMLFTFEDIGKLPARARMALFDQVPTERVILSLKGTEAEFREVVLSSLASRARRIVEAELASSGPAAQKEVVKARRAIADLALLLAERGEIELRAGEGEGGLLS